MEPHHQLSYEKCVFEEFSSVKSSSSPCSMLFSFFFFFFAVFVGIVESKPRQFTHVF